MSTAMTREEIDLQIEAMMLALGATKDRELADILAIEPTAISQWRRRLSIPKSILRRADALSKRPHAKHPRLQGQEDDEGIRRFLDSFNRLSERERHAVESLVNILSGGGGDELARIILGENSLDLGKRIGGYDRMVNESQQYYKQKDD